MKHNTDCTNRTFKAKHWVEFRINGQIKGLHVTGYKRKARKINGLKRTEK